MTARELAWRACYELLAGRVRTPDWSFMNYGYAPIGPNPLVLEPGDEPDRLCIQLYRHTIATPDLSGQNVLEVGSGRGGGSDYISRELGPRSVTGLDFSTRAIALSSRLRARAGLTFVRGDAQSMPFPESSFDAVVNIESSHCYSSMADFLAEVCRVLRPGGRLYWADFREAHGVARVREEFGHCSLSVEHSDDITANVLEALRLDDRRKQSLIDAWIPRPVRRPFRRFAAVGGSRTFTRFEAGELRYLSARLVKNLPAPR